MEARNLFEKEKRSANEVNRLVDQAIVMSSTIQCCPGWLLREDHESSKDKKWAEVKLAGDATRKIANEFAEVVKTAKELGIRERRDVNLFEVLEDEYHEHKKKELGFF